ncbi:hypothetical protein CcI49_32860 [Frankia sp. CcI49]|uniref:hypothetical protein n=1 Tax=Frankia sp. CcI49 TaxID=1745382 RepID=UPI0009789D85|nr:hypothetical protein [Frankia sp. CcI49]ONH52923.1 hypothetical protein CcI49_32860 [Frankia sp. CcI49]
MDTTTGGTVTETAAQDDSVLAAWQAEITRLDALLTDAKRAYIAAQMGLVAYQIRSWKPEGELAVDMTDAAKVETTVTHNGEDLVVTVDSILTADGSEIAAWFPRPGQAELDGLDELVCGSIEACIANGLERDGGEITLPPPSEPDPAAAAHDEEFRIDGLWQRVQEIGRRRGYWNGADVVQMLTEWFAELGFRVDDTDEEA